MNAPSISAQRAADGASPASLPERVAPDIDIVIPAYNAPEDLARCIDSVLAHTTPPYRLIVIDDASPDPRVSQILQALAARQLSHVLVLANEANLGFVATANRGMALSRADVVLLNSDTVVTRDWLDALRRCAATNPSFGTITPFSNNAEICSYPVFCANTIWPADRDPELVRRALARAAVPTYPDLPTGVGFCMYIRRALIDAIGVFDPVFGRGYGEENDLCLRGFAVGYRNVLCDDAFVLHLGGRSFEDHKVSLGRRNLDLLLERHPHYERMVQEYIAADPLRPLREAAMSRERAADGARRGVLHVIHGHGGGTEHHVRALIDATRRELRHYLAIAVNDAWQFEEHLDDASVRTYELRRHPDESWPDFVGGVCASFAIDLVHLHNISGCREGLREALTTLPLPFGYTVHDVNFACPTITFLGRDGMYCGGETDPARCGECLAAQSEFVHVDISAWRAQHRALIERAAFIVAPSAWAAAQLRRYFPGLQVDVIPHAAPGVWASQDGGPRRAETNGACVAVLMPEDDVPTVAVLGAVGPDKGARRLERLVDLARERGARVRFVLIGYLDRQQGPWQSEDGLFTVNGRYRARDLPHLLDHYRARLVVFPSAGPETFSFTLSEAWAAGRPVLVPPIGALAERVQDSGAGWVWDEATWRSESRMLDSIMSVLDDPQRLRDAATRARNVPQTTPEWMAERTIAIYRATMPAVDPSASLRPLASVRLRDALGYRLWYPPEASAPATGAYPVPASAQSAERPVATEDAPGRTGLAARLVYRIACTPLWRRVRDYAPMPLRNAVRARIKG